MTSFHKGESVYSVDESDIQSWVLNHLPLSSEQKWNLVEALKIEAQLAQAEASLKALLQQNINAQDKGPSSEPIDHKLPETDELDQCLQSVETLCLQEAK